MRQPAPNASAPPTQPTTGVAPALQNASYKVQSGVAAIEFALTIILVLMIFFGIIAFGTLFWVQQKVSDLAAEGARYALVQSSTMAGGNAAAEAGCTHVKDLASQDAILKALIGGSIDTGFCTGSEEACPGGANSCAQIAISTPVVVNSWPLLNAVQGIANLFDNGSALFPSSLSSTATIQILSES